MRLPLIAPADLTAQQKSLYDDMRKGIASNFNAFKVLREDGALMGPWNTWLHEPGIGKAIWDLTLAMTANATLVADLKPNDLTAEESVAFDLAYKLVRGGTLPEPLYRLAVNTFGQHGTNEMIYLVGLYSMVSTTLNGFNVPVPERE